MIRFNANYLILNGQILFRVVILIIFEPIINVKGSLVLVLYYFKLDCRLYFVLGISRCILYSCRVS